MHAESPKSPVPRSGRPSPQNQQVDAVEFVILAFSDQPLDRIRHRWVGGLFEHCELGLNFTHDAV
jgi:hypothetical protein